MRVVVTGGSGFIGTNLVEHLRSSGDDVLNLDIAAPRNASHRYLWRKVDLLDCDGVASAIRGFQPNVLFHLGARTDLLGHSVSDYAVNTVGTENVIRAISGLVGLHRAIFASSRLVCRIGYQPKNEEDYCATTPYGKSKIEGELIVRRLSSLIPCSWYIVRPTSIWGPWFGTPYRNFFLAIKHNRYFHPKGQSIQKSFGFVGNTVYQLTQLIKSQALAGRTLYLADWPPLEVGEFATQIQRELASKPIREIPLAALRVLAILGDIAMSLGYSNPPLTSFRLDNLITPMVHDLSPLQSFLERLPYSQEEGVRITCAWLQEGDVADGL
jgi:GlcNAc-P-P-Und epimerase